MNHFRFHLAMILTLKVGDMTKNNLISLKTANQSFSRLELNRFDTYQKQPKLSIHPSLLRKSQISKAHFRHFPIKSHTNKLSPI